MENTSNELGLLPRSEVFAKATSYGLQPGDDRFDRFRDAGLIEDLVPIKGTNQRGFTRPQAQRFLILLDLCRRLGTKRPRVSALAFWLNWYGYTDVPPELVCEHVKRTIRHVLRFLRREYGRRRVPMRSAQDPDRWRKAGMPWTKPFIREVLTSFIDNGIMLDILSTFVGLALRLLFSQVAFDVVAPILKRLAVLLKMNPDPTAMRTLWDVAAEGLGLFNPDERTNPLLGAVREVNASDPSEIITLVQDARLHAAAMAHVFPIYDITQAPEVADPSSSISVWLNRHFAPGITAILALTRTSEHAIEMRKNLRTGNVEPVLQEFYQVKVARDTLLARIRGERP